MLPGHLKEDLPVSSPCIQNKIQDSEKELPRNFKPQVEDKIHLQFWVQLTTWILSKQSLPFQTSPWETN